MSSETPPVPSSPAWWASRKRAPAYRRGRPPMDVGRIIDTALKLIDDVGIQALTPSNLGWKLGQVIAGAPDSLLDSYEAERLPVAARALGKSSELYAHLSRHRVSGLERGDEERQLDLSCHGGPLAPVHSRPPGH